MYKLDNQCSDINESWYTLVSQASRIFLHACMRVVISRWSHVVISRVAPPTNYHMHAHTQNNTAGLQDYNIIGIHIKSIFSIISNNKHP